MTRLFARALGCAIFGALAGAAAMILLSGLDPRFTLEMTQDRPGLLRGFYPGGATALTLHGRPVARRCRWLVSIATCRGRRGFASAADVAIRRRCRR